MTAVVYEPGRISRITFNRPEKRNALDAESWQLLAAALTGFEHDDAARVLILTGAGGAFSAGADLAGGITGSADAVASKLREIGEIVLRLHAMPKPTLARVDGPAVGVAMSLALGCDLVIASERARFGAIWTRIGLTADGGASWLLPRLVGPHKAKEIMLFGRMIEADELARLGLANAVVPPDELDAATTDWAERLAACPPAAATGTLTLVDAAWRSTFAEALENEAASQQVAVLERDA